MGAGCSCGDGVGKLLPWGSKGIQRPNFTWEDVEPVAAQFGKFTIVKMLDSERDQNFLLKHVDSGHRLNNDMVVLKVSNSSDDVSFIECQNTALQLAAAAGVSCQRLLRTNFAEKAMVPLAVNGNICQCRVLTFLPGKMLGEEAGKCANQPSLFAAVGTAVGSVTAALLKMQHPAAHIDNFDWDLQRCEVVISRHRASVATERRPLIDRFLEYYLKKIKPLVSRLRKSVVHNDGNDFNIVVMDGGRVGVLDFGDMLYSYTVSDAAICMAYLLFHVPAGSPLVLSMAPFLQAYNEQCRLTEVELEALFGLAVMRVVTSVCMSAYQSAQDPSNEYLLKSAAPAWKLLDRVSNEWDELINAPATLKAASEPFSCVVS